MVNIESYHSVPELRNKMQLMFGREGATGESRQEIVSKYETRNCFEVPPQEQNNYIRTT